jgi:hypothetical protein
LKKRWYFNKQGYAMSIHNDTWENTHQDTMQRKRTPVRLVVPTTQQNPMVVWASVVATNKGGKDLIPDTLW